METSKNLGFLAENYPLITLEIENQPMRFNTKSFNKVDETAIKSDEISKLELMQEKFRRINKSSLARALSEKVSEFTHSLKNIICQSLDPKIWINETVQLWRRWRERAKWSFQYWINLFTWCNPSRRFHVKKTTLWQYLFLFHFWPEKREKYFLMKLLTILLHCSLI